MEKQKVVTMDYHRNGVAGLGFYVGIVEDTSEGNKKEMLVIRFPKSADAETGGIVCAAFDLEKLAKKEIRSFHNSFRGDYYSQVMDKSIDAKAYEHESDYYFPKDSRNEKNKSKKS